MVVEELAVGDDDAPGDALAVAAARREVGSVEYTAGVDADATGARLEREQAGGARTGEAGATRA